MHTTQEKTVPHTKITGLRRYRYHKGVLRYNSVKISPWSCSWRDHCSKHTMSRYKTFSMHFCWQTSLISLTNKIAVRQVPRVYLKGQKYTEIFLKRWKLFRNVQKCGNMHPQSKYFEIFVILWLFSIPNAIKPGSYILRWFPSDALMNVLLEYFKLTALLDLHKVFHWLLYTK